MGLLRVILAVAVVIAHSGDIFGLKLTGGIVAVQIFFIISGFYMSLILDTKYCGKNGYYLFLSNRFLRIFPVYWVVLAATILLSIGSYFVFGKWGKFSNYIVYFDFMGMEALAVQIFANIALFGQDLIMFLGLDTATGKIFFTENFSKTNPQFYTFLLVPQSWSLGIELLFYLIAPIVVKRHIFVILSLIMLSVFARIFSYQYMNLDHDPWTYRFFPFELSLFLFGAISYRIYRSSPDILRSKLAVRTAYSVVFAILVGYQFLPWKEGLELHFKNWAVYLIVCLCLPFIFEVSKASRWDEKIGELSYPVYVVHILVISIFMPFLPLLKLTHFSGEISVATTLVAAFVLIKYVVEPIENMRRSRFRQLAG